MLMPQVEREATGKLQESERQQMRMVQLAAERLLASVGARLRVRPTEKTLGSGVKFSEVLDFFGKACYNAGKLGRGARLSVKGRPEMIVGGFLV